MGPTVSYGGWRSVDDSASTPEETLASWTDGGDLEWRERMEEAGAFDDIASEYRAAIQVALPPGVFLTANEFIGPFDPADREFTGYPTDEEGNLDLKAIVDKVDVGAILERHDVDASPELPNR